MMDGWSCKAFRLAPSGSHFQYQHILFDFNEIMINGLTVKSEYTFRTTLRWRVGYHRALLRDNELAAGLLEPTHEIGIRRAVAARRIDIRPQFLIEAVTISIVGGITRLVVPDGPRSPLQVDRPGIRGVSGRRCAFRILPRSLGRPFESGRVRHLGGLSRPSSTAVPDYPSLCRLDIIGRMRMYPCFVSVMAIALFAAAQTGERRSFSRSNESLRRADAAVWCWRGQLPCAEHA